MHHRHLTTTHDASSVAFPASSITFSAISLAGRTEPRSREVLLELSETPSEATTITSPAETPTACGRIPGIRSPTMPSRDTPRQERAPSTRM